MLSLYSIQGFASSCPDGSEPVKSISADGTYFVFNCSSNSENASQSNNSALTEEKTQIEWVDGLYAKSITDEFNILSKDFSKSVESGFSLIMPLGSGDFSGDGLPELVYGIQYSDLKKGSNIKPIFLTNTPGKGFSLFKPIMDIVPYTQAPRSSVIEDFNGDGVNDIFIADHGVDFDPYPGYQNTLILSAPNGKFINATSNLPQILDFTHGVTSADIDSDGDMVVDFADKCANTPKGIAVDIYGCPLDDDTDGVPNTNDDELATADGNPVDIRGVGLDSADYLLAFRKYKDSIGEFAVWDTSRRSWSSDPRSLKTIIDTKNLIKSNKQLFIVIGSDVQGVNSTDLWKKLANKDFQVRESGDSVLYVIGGYSENEIAQKIEEIKKDSGIEIQDVVKIVDDEIIPVEIPVPEPKIEIPEETDTSLVPLMIPSSEVSFRIQIGAFRNKLSKSVFRELPTVVSVFGDDSLYRFFSGSFSDKTEAASHKVNLSSSGYNDAFIVAFKDGKRITLKEAGFELNPDYEDNIEIETEPSVNPINAKLVKFRVQVGAYKEKIPTDALDMYLDIGNVLPKRDIMTGLTKYYLGEFNNYDVAADFRLKLIDKGLVDCFVVGEFKNNIISTKEAKSLLGQ